MGIVKRIRGDSRRGPPSRGGLSASARHGADDPSERETEGADGAKEPAPDQEDPGIPEPPPPQKGKKIGVLTLVLRAA